MQILSCQDKMKASPWYMLLVLSLFILSFSKKAASQTIPNFKLELTNGKMFSSAEISHQKPLIIIYFAPDCEHCQVLIKSVLKRINEFKKSQIILASFESLEQVSIFEKDYGLKSYANIKTGIEKPVFFFRYYFHLENTPFTALYDKHGKYVISYKKQTSVDDLLEHLNALK